MKLRAKLAAAAFLASAFFAGSATATDPTACLLYSGCYYEKPSDNEPGYWVCPDPSIYSLCVD